MQENYSRLGSDDLGKRQERLNKIRRQQDLFKATGFARLFLPKGMNPTSGDIGTD